MALRLIFMGTPDFSVPTLSALAEAGHEIVAVYSQPPRPAGRGQSERKSPVHARAEELGIPVLTPRNFKEQSDRDAFAAHDADIAIVVAYGLLLPKEVLDAPSQFCLNLHGSLLPRWRGAAPIQRAIMAGDEITGIMVMQMDVGLDTGPVAMTAELPISPDMTAEQLHDVMMVRGAELMVQALAAHEASGLAFVEQPEDGVTYAKKIDKAEARIDWSQSAHDVHNKIRGLSPFPGAYFELPTDKGPQRVKVLQSALAYDNGVAGTVIGPDLTVACGQGAVRLDRVQRAGKSAMAAKDFLRGAGDLVGQVLG